jgi:hypothetical protein
MIQYHNAYFYDFHFKIFSRKLQEVNFHMITLSVMVTRLLNGFR